MMQDSSSFGAPMDRSYEIIATTTKCVIKKVLRMCSRRVIGDNERVISKEGRLWSGIGCEGLGGFDSNEEEVVTKVDDVSLVDRVFDGALGGDGEEDVVMGEGMVVASSSLEMVTKSCLGGMMVSLIFFEGLEEEA
ncbi:hypothetical protein Tco_0929558 [Tanacetum coccineum]